MMLTTYLKKLQCKANFSAAEISVIVPLLIDKMTPVEQIAGLLTLLTPEKITAHLLSHFVSALRLKSTPLNIAYPVIDIVGSGGDNLNTLNISTAAALLTAAAGVPVIKHGNHAVTSKCGSADVLDALHIPIHQLPGEVIEAVRQHGFGFCYAPDYHDSLRSLKKVRHALNIPTILNLLGPLLNPANPEYLLVGIYDKKLLPLYAETLQKLHIKKALVFHSQGSDEILSFALAEGFLVTQECIEPFILHPETLGFRSGCLQDILGKHAPYNANRIIKVFEGEESVLADTIVINCAMALFVYGKVFSIQDGIQLARQTLVSGKALSLITNLRKL